MKRRHFLLWLASVGPSSEALAHGGLPALANLPVPSSRCVVVDDQARISWIDTNRDSVYGPSVVQIFTTTVARRPLYVNEVPAPPTTRLHRVLESDPIDLFVWNTATVAEGHHFVFSHVVEPPEEMSPLIIRYAPYIVTVQHGDRPIGPTVVLTRPDIFAGSLGTAKIHYTACDPTGTARVRIDVTHDPGDGVYRVLFDDLPAVPTATVTWDTRPFEMGRWIVRATIADDCGHVFESYARGFLEVRDPVDPFDASIEDARVADLVDARTGGGAACLGRPDAAAPDSSPDAGSPDTTPMGAEPNDTLPVDGCACSTAHESPTWHAGTLLLILVVVRASRRSGQLDARACGSPRRPRT